MARVDRTERLLNLVFALMASRRPVSRAQIQDVVPGYAGDQGDAAFERMFERDKDELRSMGIPIETVLTLDGEVEGYRIDPETYAQHDLSFDPAEMAVLALAASVWDREVLGPSAVRAMRKIEATQGGTASATTQGLRVHLGAEDQGLLPLLQALRESRAVTFAYRNAEGDEQLRHCDPWGVVSEQGRWYLVAWDTDRGATRVFRLSRIIGNVTVTARTQEHPIPGGTNLRALVLGQSSEIAETVQVAVSPGDAAQLRRLSPTQLDAFSAGTIDIPVGARSRVIAAVAAAGDGAVVIGPEWAREAVVASLRRVADLHG